MGDSLVSPPLPPPLPHLGNSFGTTPPPPPPSFKSVPCSSKNDGRSALLEDIRKGASLKKTPFIEPTENVCLNSTKGVFESTLNCIRLMLLFKFILYSIAHSRISIIFIFKIHLQSPYRVSNLKRSYDFIHITCDSIYFYRDSQL